MAGNQRTHQIISLTSSQLWASLVCINQPKGEKDMATRFYETFIIVYSDGSYAADALEPTTRDLTNVAQFDSFDGAMDDVNRFGGKVRIGRWESRDGIANPDVLVAHRELNSFNCILTRA